MNLTTAMACHTAIPKENVVVKAIYGPQYSGDIKTLYKDGLSELRNMS
jgi:hypothetical protein